MSTSLDITVNESTYRKYQEVLDAKELVSATQITYNFMDGALLRISTSLLREIEDNFKYYAKVGKENSGINELKEIYLPKEYQYSFLVFYTKFKDKFDKDNILKGCLVLEINKQHKLFCAGKRGRKKKSY